MRLICTLTIWLSFILTGCAEERASTNDEGGVINGFVIELEKGRILVAENITSEDYIEIKDKSLQELQEEQIELIYFSYKNNEDVKVGDKVEVWIKDGIDDSYPAQAQAQKIKVQKYND